MIAELVFLCVVMTLVASCGRRLVPTVPYPTLMVLAGILIAVFPAVPQFEVSPEAIKNVILPPLLYSAAWYTTWATLRRQSWRVAGLSVGLVIATVAAVAFTISRLHPELPVFVGILLGAIVAPPDAIAAVSIAARVGLPSRTTALLEGESLVNDATSLIIYKISLAAVLSGVTTSFDAGAMVSATQSFVLISAGGVIVGLAAGTVVVWLHRKLRDPVLETVLTLQAPYLAFLPAEAVGASGVLAVVVSGLLVGRRSATAFSAELRLQAIAVWDIAVFILNGFAFVLIGLAVKDILHAASSSSFGRLALDAILVCVTVIVVRIVWIACSAGAEKLLALVVGQGKETLLSFGEMAVVSWAGMRGAVSLAVALALPLTLNDGGPFPFRNEMLILTFAVIATTLIGQGLTLPALVRRAGIGAAADHGMSEIRRIRRDAAEAALQMLHRYDGGNAEAIDRVKEIYRRKRDLADAVSQEHRSVADAQSKLHAAALAIERNMAVQLRDKGEIDDEVLHAILKDLDLEEARLAPSRQTRGIA